MWRLIRTDETEEWKKARRPECSERKEGRALTRCLKRLMSSSKHFFDEFSETKPSLFLKNVIENRSSIDVMLIKRTWRTPNCTPKIMKVIREI